jgi:AraC-like DNA-binding protein
VLRTLYRTQRFSRHYHDTYTFGLGLRGYGAIWYRGRNHYRCVRDVVIIPPGEVHTGGVRDEETVLSYMAVYLPPDVFRSCASMEGVEDIETSDYGAPVIRDQDTTNALRVLYDALWTNAVEREGAPCTPDLVAAEDAIHMTVATLLRRHPRSRSSAAESADRVYADDLLVRRVREMLEECYADRRQTSLRELALRTGVTPFYVVRRFARATGLSPHQYLIQVRVNSARRLLASGVPPSMVAASAGFVDQSHLTVHFKRFTGMTPARYQRACSLSRGRSGSRD